jgi:GABA(A) receptor-associated protein
MSTSFTEYHTFEKRKAISNRIAQVYPDRIAIVINQLNDNTPTTSKYKFLVSKGSSFGNFSNNVREYITSINSQQALFFFVNGTVLVPNDALISTVYDRYKADDNILYVVYALENTYG